MKRLIFLICIIFSFNVFSLSKEDLKKSLDQMKASGMFTPEQLKAAEQQLMGMDEAQLNALIQKGQEKAKDPAYQKKVNEAVKEMQKKQKQ